MGSRRFIFPASFSHCGGPDAERAGQLDSSSVVDFTSQMAALEQADVCITHAALKTGLHRVRAGTPMLALLIALDQPGVGARIIPHRIDESLPAKRASTAGIRSRLLRLLTTLETCVSADAPCDCTSCAPAAAPMRWLLWTGFSEEGCGPRLLGKDINAVSGSTKRRISLSGVAKLVR